MWKKWITAAGIALLVGMAVYFVIMTLSQVSHMM